MVIVGGGCAGMAAAWQLSKLPGYEIHVYEQSWRLGGKGSSVRDAAGRIQEHGLHVWFGFYENAFRMMRECYREVKRRKWAVNGDNDGKLVHGSMDEAFFPEPDISVAGRDASNQWSVWTGLLPPAKGLPGETIDADSNPFTLQSYVIRCFDLVRALMVSVIGPPSQDLSPDERGERRSALDEALDLDFSFDPARSPAVFIEGLGRLVRGGTLTTAAGLLQAVTIIERLLQQFNYAPQVADSMLKLMQAVAAQIRKQLRDLVAVDQNLRRKTEIIDIVMTIAVGLWRDRVLLGKEGLDALNNVDYRVWLLSHGATRSSVLESPFMKGIYDLVFAYVDGDVSRPQLAAGVALRGALRMFFTYRGSMFWRMRSGMGDCVFAPLYKALRARWQVPLPGNQTRESSPVHFHFLHRLDKVSFQFAPKDRRLVTGLTFSRHGDPATLSNYALDERGSFFDAARMPFDPPPDALPPLELAVGQHFEAVIFATAAPDVARVFRKGGFFDKGNGPAHWHRIEEQPTVATKSAQVWLSKSLEELGWYRGSGIVTALGLAFQTWADMTHTLPVEARAGAARDPRSVAYFCGVLSEDDVFDFRDDPAPVAAALDSMLLSGMRDAWPAAYPAIPPDPGATGTAKDLEIARYVVSNVAGSDRYALSLPGTIEDRVSPLDPAIANMSVAGDWTACGLDAGCVEAAVMSGLLAAHALSGEPALASIVGYDHP